MPILNPLIASINTRNRNEKVIKGGKHSRKNETVSRGYMYHIYGVMGDKNVIEMRRTSEK